MNATRHERQPMWPTRKELEAVLAQAGLGEWSPRLAAAARHAMILEPGPVEEGADAPIGASRLGGTPDLPAEVPWPWRPALPDGTVFKEHLARPWPLSFVAQIDFADILSAGGLEGFPSSGRLLFFCDPIETWGTTRASVMFITEQTDRLGRLERLVSIHASRAAPVGEKAMEVGLVGRDRPACREGRRCACAGRILPFRLS